MTLDQLMDLEGISDYNVWWYGITIGEHSFDDGGFSHPTIAVHRGADLGGRVYVVLAGIDGKRARYKFAIRLKEDLGEKVYSWERVPLSIDQYQDRLLFRCTRNSSRRKAVLFLCVQSSSGRSGYFILFLSLSHVLIAIL